MLQEGGHQVGVRRVVLGERPGHAQHREAVAIHPGRRIGLLERARDRQV